LRFRLDFGVTEGVGSRCHVLRARTHFWRTEGVGSRFLVLWSQTRFRWCRLRRVPFSCFARSDSFSAVPRASGPGLIFGSTECVGSHFHVFLSRTCFRRYQGCQDSFSCFALSDSFSSVPSASGPVFMFCTLGLVFDGAEGVGTRFHILRSRTRFSRYRGRQDLFSCFALADSFSAVLRASVSVFMFCAPGLVFGSTECVGSRFHVLRARTCFQWCRVRRVPFS
jgi:hypothetical protein